MKLLALLYVFNSEIFEESALDCHDQQLVEYILLQEFATGTGVDRQQTSTCFLTQTPPLFPSPPLALCPPTNVLSLSFCMYQYSNGSVGSLFCAICCCCFPPFNFTRTYLLYIPSLMCYTSAHQSPKKVLAQSIYVLLFDSPIYTNPPPPLSSTCPSVSSLSVVIKNGRSLLPQLFRSFNDLEGAACFGELEGALFQGVDGMRGTEDTKSFLASRPATLEIFPSWPMIHQQTPRVNTLSARSFDPGSAQNYGCHMGSDSPDNSKDSSGELADRKQQQEMMMSSTVSRTGETRNPQPSSQEKRTMTGSTTAKDGKVIDDKALRRLAQNREAARKSRLRKKAYVQQLESSKVRLQQIEHDLDRARSQGLFLAAAGSTGVISPGAALFDMEYARWLAERCKLMSVLRNALQAHPPEGNLGVLVDECIRHYDELFQLKATVAKADVFHLLNGTWKTPAERCFLWMGGFKPSELLNILIPKLDPLEQQRVWICNLKHSSEQAEEALSLGLGHLHLSLAQIIAGRSLCDGIGDGEYMNLMAAALGKLVDFEEFVSQADNLRRQTLHNLRRHLTIRLAARCFLAIGEYYTRLRALSSILTSRSPRESLIADDTVVPTTTDLQIVHRPLQHHFYNF
ncbi:transcription factor TGAL5-like isoform X2 [Musa acuminata AAA Group]|uniref:transcription factor TGAL5 isoform X2 n=1 Tax=Musa acuminata AAA Group TaxID=214697 RepID=UPI0031D82455